MKHALHSVLKVFNLVNIILFSVILVAQADENLEVRLINPPKLDDAYLGQKILCHRPMRHGKPNMSIEQIGNKLVGHNYGHGGSGWTLGPHSAIHVNEMMTKYAIRGTLQHKTPIAIIGAGALGLYTAHNLVKKGFENITIYAERFTGLASHNAGGLLVPASMDNDPETQILIDQIGLGAYDFYKRIANGMEPEFAGGAFIIPIYFETREESGFEPYVGEVMEPAKDVILDFGNGTTREMVAYDDGIFIDTTKLMESLTIYLKDNGVKFEKRKISAFEELEESFVFNCSGLGAEQLNNDSEMESVQGHLIMLKDQEPQDLQHVILIYLDKDKTSEGFDVKRSYYISPKHLPSSGARDVGVIGGTFIEGATASNPNHDEFDIIVKNAKEFYGLE